MLTGKPNKKWVEQLDGLELPAGSSFDKNTAWTKLQQRLDQKQRKKGLAWRITTVAAAMLLLVYLIIDKQDTRIITPIHATIAVSYLPASIVTQPTPVIAASSPAIFLPGNNRKEKITNPIVTTHNNDTITENTPLIVSSLPVADTTVATATISKRKKMAVVHNNELEPPVLSIPVKRTTPSTAGLLAEYRKHQDLILELTDTLNHTKPRKKLLPFNLISQKQ
jgi:hypothetical protein